MWLKNNDTIAAIATPAGMAGVGVIRISGNNVINIAAGLLSIDKLEPNYAAFTKFLNDNQEVIDSGIAIFFRGPKSFTGEDVLELQGHGNPVLLDLLLSRAFELGARMAEPGEFSRRAFLNNKIDLAQAESVLSLIHANTKQAALAAQCSLQGGFSQRIKKLQQDLTNFTVQIEAALEFAEDLATEDIKLNQWSAFLLSLRHQLQQVLANASLGSLLVNGVKIAILGAPNVGKSSLLNLLAEQDAAIVSSVPGTTRDVVAKTINLNGTPIEVLDTAGIRDSTDEIEKTGIEKAYSLAKKVDLLLWVTDNPKDQEIPEDIANLAAKKIIVINKIDQHEQPCPKTIELEEKKIVYISVKKQLGIDLLKKLILKTFAFNYSPDVFSARTRHIVLLRQALSFVESAISLGAHSKLEKIVELLAEELRMANFALGEITGQFCTEKLLDQIFSEFCIGK